MSASDWKDRLVMGDPMAFAELVKETQNVVFAIAYGYAQNSAVAEDLAQETYMKAFASLNGLKDPAKIKPWLFRIAHFTSIDWIRKKKVLSEDVEQVFGDSMTNEEANENCAKSRRLEFVKKALARLKPLDRTIVVLRFMEDMSYKEIAATLDMSVTAVGERLHRVRKSLEENVRNFSADMNETQ